MDKGIEEHNSLLIWIKANRSVGLHLRMSTTDHTLQAHTNPTVPKYKNIAHTFYTVHMHAYVYTTIQPLSGPYIHISYTMNTYIQIH